MHTCTCTRTRTPTPPPTWRTRTAMRWWGATGEGCGQTDGSACAYGLVLRHIVPLRCSLLTPTACTCWGINRRHVVAGHIALTDLLTVKSPRRVRISGDPMAVHMDSHALVFCSHAISGCHGPVRNNMHTGTHNMRARMRSATHNAPHVVVHMTRAPGWAISVFCCNMSGRPSAAAKRACARGDRALVLGAVPFGRARIPSRRFRGRRTGILRSPARRAPTQHGLVCVGVRERVWVCVGGWGGTQQQPKREREKERERERERESERARRGRRGENCERGARGSGGHTTSALHLSSLFEAMSIMT